MKKLLSIILIATLALAGCELFPTKTNTEAIVVEKAAVEAMRPHIEEDIPLMDTWVESMYREERQMTTDEYLEYQRRRMRSNISLATFINGMQEQSGGINLLEILLQQVGLDGLATKVRNGNMDPVMMGKLEAIVLELSRQGENIRELNNKTNNLINKVNSNEARISAIEIQLDPDEGEDPEPKPAPNLPIVKDKQSLIDFCVALLGREAVHGTTNHTRDELAAICYRIRDAIIENQPDDYYFSFYNGGFRDREWYNSNRMDIVADLETRQNIDFFAAPAKRYATVEAHLRWSRGDVQPKPSR